MKKCCICKELKLKNEFGNHKNRYDGLQTTCKSCRRTYDRERFQKNKDYFRKINAKTRLRNRHYIINILKERFCVDCGEKDLLVLDFDHIRDKKFSIATMSYQSIKTLQLEINKCEVRCANCHRRKTAKEENWFKFYLKS